MPYRIAFIKPFEFMFLWVRRETWTGSGRAVYCGPMNDTLNLSKIRKAQQKFVSEREWEPFHTPKNLAMALAGESGELLEIFQWLSQEQSKAVMGNPGKAREVRDELADILFYLVRLAEKLDVDLEEAFWDKMKQNAEKYPVHLARGTAKKYTEYSTD